MHKNCTFGEAENAKSRQLTRLNKAMMPWQGWQDSNPRHAVLETAALPAELHPYG